MALRSPFRFHLRKGSKRIEARPMNENIWVAGLLSPIWANETLESSMRARSASEPVPILLITLIVGRRRLGTCRKRTDTARDEATDGEGGHDFPRTVAASRLRADWHYSTRE